MLEDLEARARELGFHIPRVLLPDHSLLESWPVIACDQHTSDSDYWDAVLRRVGKRPSALGLILPEAWIGTPLGAEHLSGIAARASDLLRSDKLLEQPPGLVLVQRRTESGVRRGLLLAVDLERYSYDPRSRATVVATEETIASRLPLRIRVRAESPIEVSHVLALVDDREAPLASLATDQTPSLRLRLPEGGGDLELQVLTREQDLHRALAALGRISAAAESAGRPVVLIGDGNHSLAAAREHWIAIRGSVDSEDPRRFAMLELVSIHDPALPFEPIHRWIRGLDAGALTEQLGLRSAAPGGTSAPSHCELGLVCDGGKEHPVWFPGSAVDLARRIELLSAEAPELSVDYVHGADALGQLVVRRGGCGLRFPPIERERLFATIADQGVLPRKMFSLGESNEKRYYVEARLLRSPG